MLEEIIKFDKKLLVFLNSFHIDWLDPVIYQVTKTQFWVPLYLLLIYLIFKTFNNQAWLYLAGAALAILLADQITASLMKPYFARLRPSQDPALQGIIHLVNDYKGGLYGFASSHAANTFATALFSTLVLREKYKWILVVFIWAILMTYTRIYLGVHFPGDIFIGGLVGLGSGYAGFRFSKWLIKKSEGKKASAQEETIS